MIMISIIVPIYQASKNLCRCIDSILSQTFTDFELLLIDDGSSDGSGEICDKYAVQDSRVISIHQSNQGVSATRNKGISLAKGKYIMFCDSDDVVDSCWCEYLYAAAFKNPSHFITCDNQYVTSDGKMIPSKIDEKNFNIVKSYFELWRLGLSIFVTTKIYEKELIVNHNISFREDICFAEDVVFNVDYFRVCNGIIVIPKGLYIYHDTPSGLMHKKYDDFYPVFSLPFSIRLPLITTENIGEYCDFWLGGKIIICFGCLTNLLSLRINLNFSQINKINFWEIY